MRIHVDTLKQFVVGLPKSDKDIANLLDDVGIEVKKISQTDFGTVLTLELLANRGDHHCYMGIAREAHGRIGTGLKEIDCKDISLDLSDFRSNVAGVAGKISKGFLQVKIETPYCLAYSLTHMEVGSSKTLPQEMIVPLSVDEIQSGHGVVDITNFVNREIGQPLHSFDADELVGQVTVRISRKGEKARLLFTENEIEIPEGHVVIADEQGIIAVAGVMGCERGKVTDKTKRIALESALFDPVKVRLAARALKISSDSSQRFERGADYQNVLKGASRAIELLEQHAGAQVLEGPFYYEAEQSPDYWPHKHRKLSLNLPRLDKYLHLQLNRDEVIERLQRYGFAISGDNGEDSSNETLSVVVPSYRTWDVESTQCLYEELAKSISFESVPPSLPDDCMGSLPTAKELMRELVERVLLGAGFYEVITDGFYGRNSLTKLGIHDEDILGKHIETINSLDKSFSLLKNNGLVQALELLEYNRRFGADGGKVFEWTRLFEAKGDASYCHEKPILWGIAQGSESEKKWNATPKEIDIWYLKGMLAEIGHVLGKKFVLTTIGNFEDGLWEKLHPKKRFWVLLDGKMIGFCGALHPSYQKNYKLGKASPYYFQLATEFLSEPELWSHGEEKVPEFLPINRNISFHIPKDIVVEDVLSVMREQVGEELYDLRVLDFFEKSEDGKNIRSFTFDIFFKNDNKISSDTINSHLDQMIIKLQGRFGSKGLAHR